MAKAIGMVIEWSWVSRGCIRQTDRIMFDLVTPAENGIVYLRSSGACLPKREGRNRCLVSLANEFPNSGSLLSGLYPRTLPPPLRTHLPCDTACCNKEARITTSTKYRKKRWPLEVRLTYRIHRPSFCSDDPPKMTAEIKCSSDKRRFNCYQIYFCIWWKASQILT